MLLFVSLRNTSIVMLLWAFALLGWTEDCILFSQQFSKTKNNFFGSEALFFFLFFCFILFAIFILHSRESELYRYTLDGKSALAWELPFSRFMGHLSST